MKIDVEGAELSVLKGAERTFSLDRSKDSVIILRAYRGIERVLGRDMGFIDRE